MQKKPNGLGRGLGALLNPELLNTQPAAVNTAALNDQSAKQDETTLRPILKSPNLHRPPESRKAAAAPAAALPTLDNLKTQDLVVQDTHPEQRVLNLNVTNLRPLRDQPRTEFYSSTLDELATSIKNYGILQPLVVTQTEPGGHYTIIAGERRWRAAQIAGLETVPCVMRQPREHSALELALIENIQREELSALDEARAFSRLLDEYSYTQDTLASKVGKDRATIANSLRLLSLPPEILADIQSRAITAGHARALCSLDEKKLQLKVRDMIVSKKLSVRQTEDIVKELKKDRDAADAPAKTQLSPDLRYLCDQFKGHLGTKVRITGDADRGKIEISYYTFEDLERIAELMLSKGLNPRRPVG
ncbi:MAG: ParB/RepB/Spo0J family partition protein [Betaproteobacteria bacterium]|nr:ParB/RepB/Spo0J family partition protein [Betaproteobacteria bacterium]